MTKYLRITKIPNQFVVQSAKFYIAAVDDRHRRVPEWITDVRVLIITSPALVNANTAVGRNVYLFTSPELDQTFGATESLRLHWGPCAVILSRWSGR